MEDSYKPKTCEVLGCLFDVYDWMELLKQRNKPYDALINYLIKIAKERHAGVYDDKSVQVKEIVPYLGLETPQIMKWIRQIYDDLFDLNENYPQLFKQDKCIFHHLYFHTDYGGAYFAFWLPARLHGDRFICHFLQAKICETDFFVERVEYEQVCTSFEIMAHLTRNYNKNIYRTLLSQKLTFMAESKRHYLEKRIEWHSDKDLLQFLKEEGGL